MQLRWIKMKELENSWKEQLSTILKETRYYIEKKWDQSCV